MPAKVVVLGTSLGGLRALQTILAALPSNWGSSLAIVQHRDKNSDSTLLGILAGYSKVPVVEVEDRQRILPGHVFLAPPDYHLLVERGRFALTVEDPVNYARPSIDVLFASAADAYTDRVVGVLLTGANADGAAGLAAIKSHGGLVVVQDPATAEASAMPNAGIAAVKVDKVLSLEQIGVFLAGIEYLD